MTQETKERMAQALEARGCRRDESIREAETYLKKYKKGNVEPELMLDLGITEEELKRI